MGILHLKRPSVHTKKLKTHFPKLESDGTKQLFQYEVDNEPLIGTEIFHTRVFLVLTAICLHMLYTEDKTEITLTSSVL